MLSLGFVWPASTLLRLMAGYQELEKKQKTVLSIVIDNARDADLMERFLSGEVRDKDGRDAYSFFNLEKYRDRLFMIFCGERGDFNKQSILIDINSAA